MMNEQNQKPKVNVPPDFPQLDAATAKDECYDVPERGSEEWISQQARLDKFFEAEKAGRIPQYPGFTPRNG